MGNASDRAVQTADQFDLDLREDVQVKHIVIGSTYSVGVARAHCV